MQAPIDAGPSTIEIITVVVRALTLIVVTLSAFFAFQQIRKTQEWNRRKASQDLLFQVVTGDVNRLRSTLEVEYGVNIRDPGQTFSTVDGTVPADKRAEFEFHLRALFNYFETIAIGIKNNVLDEDICYEHLSLVATKYWLWAEPLTRKLRAIHPSIWIEQEHFYKPWTDRNNEQTRLLRNPAKPRI